MTLLISQNIFFKIELLKYIDLREFNKTLKNEKVFKKCSIKPIYYTFPMLMLLTKIQTGIIFLDKKNGMNINN